MNTKTEKLNISDYEIDVVRKDIKNMHLAVYPPTGRIRLAVPTETKHDVLRLFAISKIGWIKKHIRNFHDQQRESVREYVSGESHYWEGKRYLLKVIHHSGHNKVEMTRMKYIKLYVRPEATIAQREDVLKKWYRKKLKSQIPPLLEKWESIIGVQADSWGVRQMRTKWGACNIERKKIWVNLELAKKPITCLEYIIVHELIHLLERTHNDHFVRLMDKHMPKWRLYKKELNSLPLSYSNWGY